MLSCILHPRGWHVCCGLRDLSEGSRPGCQVLFAQAQAFSEATLEGRARGSFRPDETPTGYLRASDVCDDSSISEDSAEQEHPDHREVEQAIDHVMGIRRENAAGLADGELGGLFRHSLFRVIYCSADEAGSRLNCGRDISKGNTACTAAGALEALRRACHGPASVGSMNLRVGEGLSLGASTGCGCEWARRCAVTSCSLQGSLQSLVA